MNEISRMRHDKIHARKYFSIDFFEKFVKILHKLLIFIFVKKRVFLLTLFIISCVFIHCIAISMVIEFLSPSTKLCLKFMTFCSIIEKVFHSIFFFAFLNFCSKILNYHSCQLQSLQN